MSNSRRNAIMAIAFLVNLVPFFVAAQSKHSNRKGEFYFSWGYNTEWYTHSNITVNQPELGNYYTFNHVRGHDHKGWDEGLLSKALTIPQYNYRLGYYFNKKKGLAFEINFDHTKFIFADQDVRVTGKLNGSPKSVDTSIAFNQANGFYYYLNNGANFLLFNIVKRWHLYEDHNENIKIDVMGKAGIGPVIPHVENSLFGQKNDPKFQYGGWNVGVENAIRATFFRYAYVEFAHKIDYARYSHLQVYKGRARQAFGTYELILSLGVTFPTGKKI
ncbi:hypothetical protein A3860_14590 [Niastella vici]|uniref:Outer membrane protein beta-barrel domain-containing protein n=1 Tax=Niastella vici TaxID=1703345 RepID=A0A1V9G5I7_9BACT|nr:hypothetical protein [Niastella vici]OQP65822.1 hypothetical protein A3860_14590 [Niastella vici]